MYRINANDETKSKENKANNMILNGKFNKTTDLIKKNSKLIPKTKKKNAHKK